jgi:AcrR family transcriptional regulator
VLSIKGYAGTRLSDVAEFAEVQTPAIYYYFSSRDDLIEEVMYSGIADITEHLRPVLDALPPVLEIIGRPLHDQLRVEAMWGYALCGGNTTVMERSQQFFDKVDRGRAGATANPV